MTLRTLWVFVAVALPILPALAAGISTVDLAYHLRAGGELLDTGRIPMADTYTFTLDGAPWLNQQWGAQGILAAVFRLGGWTGLAVLRAVLTSVLAAIVLTACRRQGLDVRRSAVLTLAAFVLSAVALSLRPQLFGMVLFGLVLLLVVERRRHPRLLWLVPPIVLVWANLHGSFFLGPAVVGFAWLVDLAERRAGSSRVLAVALLAALAACVTPYGPAVWLYAAGLSTNPIITEGVTEWQPTSIRTPAGLGFYLSALAVVAILARTGRRVPWLALLWFAGFFLLGAWIVRGAAWWPTAAAVGLAGILGTGFLGSGAATVDIPDTADDRRRPLNAVLAAVLVLAAVVLLPGWRPVEPGSGAPSRLLDIAPSALTAAIRDVAEPGDRIFAPQPMGSWLELAVPEAPVFLDSRLELYPVSVLNDYEAIAAGRSDWSAILDRWGVTVVVATNERTGGLLAQLRESEAWRSVHADDDGEVFVRTERG